MVWAGFVVPDCAKNIKQFVSSRKLTLAELEAGTCARLTRLLPLDFAGVTGQESLGLQGGTVSLSIEIAQSTGDPEPDGFRLAFGATTDHVHLNVKLTFCLSDGERLVHDVLERALLEVILKGTIIDRDVAFTGRKINTSDG